MSTRKARGFSAPARLAEDEAPPSREAVQEFAAAATVRSSANGLATPAIKPARPGRRPREETIAIAEHELDFVDFDDRKRNSLYNLRLTAREHAALKFIEEKKKISMQRVCMDAVRDAINTHLREIADAEI